MKHAIRTALATLLATDAQFIADMAALKLGTTGTAAVPKVLQGNRPFEQLGQEHYPCWLLEADDDVGQAGSNGADGAGIVIGSHQQDWSFGLQLALVWHAQDYAAAQVQRDGVLPALVRLLLRNPDLSNTCDLAFVERADHDRGMRHPTHTIVFGLHAQAAIYRD